MTWQMPTIGEELGKVHRIGRGLDHYRPHPSPDTTIGKVRILLKPFRVMPLELRATTPGFSATQLRAVANRTVSAIQATLKSGRIYTPPSQAWALNLREFEMVAIKDVWIRQVTRIA